jgi:nucleoside-diphosphate-sugar epimerase
MKALVTGCAGFIGSSLSEALIGQGFEHVYGVDCFTDYYPQSLKRSNIRDLVLVDRFTLFVDDLCTMDLGWLKTTGITHIFHLAGQAGVRASWGEEFGHYTRNNIEATQVLLEAVRAQYGPGTWPAFVYASSSSVYGGGEGARLLREDDRPEPVSPYGVTKLAAELLCRSYFYNFGMPTVGLRYFTVYGPRQRPDMAFRRFIQAAMKGEPVEVFGDGSQTRDFTYISDIVAGTIAASITGQPGAVYNLGGGDRVDLLTVIDMIGRIVRPLRTEMQGRADGDVKHTWADTSAAQRDLGFVPQWALLDGLRAEYFWMRAEET